MSNPNHAQPCRCADGENRLVRNTLGAADALGKLRHVYSNLVNGGVRGTASAKRIAELERALSAPASVAGAPSEPVAWWRTSYVDEQGNSDADVQIGKKMPTDQLISDNGFPWSPLYDHAAPSAAASKLTGRKMLDLMTEAMKHGMCVTANQPFDALPLLCALASAAAPSAATGAIDDALIFKLECFIDHATGGKLSKSSWTLETLKSAHDEHLNAHVDEALAERAASQDEAPAPLKLMEAGMANDLNQGVLMSDGVRRYPPSVAREPYGVIIKTLSDLLTAHRTDKQFDADVQPSDPVRAAAMTIRQALDEIMKCVPKVDIEAIAASQSNAGKQDLIECLLCRKFWHGVDTEKCPHCGGPELVTVGAMHKCRTGAHFDQCVNCGAMAEALSKPCKAFLAKADRTVLASQDEAPAPNAVFTDTDRLNWVMRVYGVPGDRSSLDDAMPKAVSK